jgi:hypothetical protein
MRTLDDPRFATIRRARAEAIEHEDTANKCEQLYLRVWRMGYAAQGSPALEGIWQLREVAMEAARACRKRAEDQPEFREYDEMLRAEIEEAMGGIPGRDAGA